MEWTFTMVLLHKQPNKFRDLVLGMAEIRKFRALLFGKRWRIIKVR